MSFNLTSLTNCEHCGKAKSSSEEQCDYCDEIPNIDIVFQNIQTGSTRVIQVSTVHDHNFLWEKLARSLDTDSPISYGLLGSREHVERLCELNVYSEASTIPPRQHITEYDGEKTLTEL
jgi:hypothetical protein